MNSELILKDTLHQFGLKVTNARIKVLQVLMQSQVALSHGDILSRINGDDLDKVTLYRTLGSFVSVGLAHKVATEDRNWLYGHLPADGQQNGIDEHAHFICDSCERIYCLPHEADDELTAPVTENGFVIRSQEYRLHGICPECN